MEGNVMDGVQEGSSMDKEMYDPVDEVADLLYCQYNNAKSPNEPHCSFRYLSPAEKHGWRHLAIHVIPSLIKKARKRSLETEAVPRSPSEDNEQVDQGGPPEPTSADDFEESDRGKWVRDWQQARRMRRQRARYDGPVIHRAPDPRKYVPGDFAERLPDDYVLGENY